MPQQFDGALVAIGRQHAGAAELEEVAGRGAASISGADVEFAGGVEAAIFLGELLAQQAIGADHCRLAVRTSLAVVVEHQQVVADRVECIDVAAREQPAGIGQRRTFLIENAVAQLLRLAHFGGGLRQPHFERADAAQRLHRAMRACGPGLQSAIGLQLRHQAGNAGICMGRKRSNNRRGDIAEPRFAMVLVLLA